MKKEYDVNSHSMLRSYGLNRLDTYEMKYRTHIIKNYFKFIVVRHPFERLVSAYRAKFGGSNGVQRYFELYVPYITNNEKGANVTFSKFVDYLISIYNISYKLYQGVRTKDYIKSGRPIDKKTLSYINEGLDETFSTRRLRRGSKYYDGHWAQFSTVCHPCHVHYDYVVKFDTVREDAGYILEKLGQLDDHSVEDKFPELFKKMERSSSVYKQYIANLTLNQQASLKKIYGIDFELFGYEM